MVPTVVIDLVEQLKVKYSIKSIYLRVVYYIVIKAAFIHLMFIINCAKKKALSEVCPER